MSLKKAISLAVCVAGIILILAGLFISVPGTELTTYQSLDGKKSDYSDTKYSSIEEYVGGDAYNYIIGASLVGGKIAGAKAQKAIFISAGLLIVALGALAFAYSEENVKTSYITPATQNDPSPVSKIEFNSSIKKFISSDTSHAKEEEQETPQSEQS